MKMLENLKLFQSLEHLKLNISIWRHFLTYPVKSGKYVPTSFFVLRKILKRK